VPAVRDFLERFRPAGAPGPAAAAVPADRRAELAAELEPVFALVAGAEAESAAIVTEGMADARRILELAGEEAAHLVARARERAAAERAGAAAAALAPVEGERADPVAEARHAAEAIRGRAAVLVPELTGRALAGLGLLDGST
jgi:cell division septum initiation protein DivIVA